MIPIAFADTTSTTLLVTQVVSSTTDVVNSSFPLIYLFFALFLLFLLYGGIYLGIRRGARNIARR